MFTLVLLFAFEPYNITAATVLTRYTLTVSHFLECLTTGILIGEMLGKIK